MKQKKKTMKECYEHVFNCIHSCIHPIHLDNCIEMRDGFMRKWASDPNEYDYNYFVGMLANVISKKKELFKSQNIEV